MPATDACETSGSRIISRPRLLSPEGKHSNISADRESLNQYIYGLIIELPAWPFEPGGSIEQSNGISNYPCPEPNPYSFSY